MTDERFLRANLDDTARKAFFASGEADVSRFLQSVGRAETRPHNSALDFGCGVGRLTRAVAGRFDHVVGVDISPTMLEHARRNVPGATFVERIPDEEFDFIISLIVLQHIEVNAGLSIIGQLLARLRRNGSIVLQVPIRREGGVIRRVGRQLRARSPLLHRLLSGEKRPLPYMQMNAYKESTIRRLIAAAGCAVSSLESTTHDGIQSITVIARKT